jgi:uncharacterized protein (TIGR02646 family)
MRAIVKGAEPPSHTAYRQTPHSNYGDCDKNVLRDALIAEQRGLCCYCMDRIRNGWDTMKIEHWRCRSRHPAEQLNYRNLLGACMGGEGQPPHLRHCDTRKEDQDLQWNPADPTHHIETRIRYEMDGSIRSDESVFDKQLDDVLNLNLTILRNNRKAVLNAVLTWWKLEKAQLRGPVPRAQFQRERDLRVAGNDELAPFCQVAIWWLDQRLARMSA